MGTEQLKGTKSGERLGVAGGEERGVKSKSNVRPEILGSEQ